MGLTASGDPLFDPRPSLCGCEYQEATGTSAVSGICACGTFAIGTCQDCGRPVCGNRTCSLMYSNRRVCVRDYATAAEILAFEPSDFLKCAAIQGNPGIETRILVGEGRTSIPIPQPKRLFRATEYKVGLSDERRTYRETIEGWPVFDQRFPGAQRFLDTWGRYWHADGDLVMSTHSGDETEWKNWWVYPGGQPRQAEELVSTAARLGIDMRPARDRTLDKARADRESFRQSVERRAAEAAQERTDAWHALRHFPFERFSQTIWAPWVGEAKPVCDAIPVAFLGVGDGNHYYLEAGITHDGNLVNMDCGNGFDTSGTPQMDVDRFIAASLRALLTDV